MPPESAGGNSFERPKGRRVRSGSISSVFAIR